MKKKQSSLFDEEMNALALKFQVRQKKKDYVVARNKYFELLENTLSVAYFQNRTLSKVESFSLQLYYRKYLDTYFEWLTLREKLSHYTRKVKWLLSSV